MAAPSTFDKAHFQQHVSQRNETVKNKIASIYISTAKGTLMSPPFSYSEKISGEVSEGIVNYGDKLMSNAMAESDDDDEMDELNQIGEDFQAMVPATALELTIDQQPPPVDMVHNLYPMPDKGFYISKSTVSQFAKGLEEIRNFLKMRAFQGFTAAIILLGQWTADGVVFGGNQTVPVEVVFLF